MSDRIVVQTTDEMIASIDEWIVAQSSFISLQEAVTRLVAQALETRGNSTTFQHLQFGGEQLRETSKVLSSDARPENGTLGLVGAGTFWIGTRPFQRRAWQFLTSLALQDPEVTALKDACASG